MLPVAEVQQSFAYGSSGVPDLPKKVAIGDSRTAAEALQFGIDAALQRNAAMVGFSRPAQSDRKTRSQSKEYEAQKTKRQELQAQVEDEILPSVEQEVEHGGFQQHGEDDADELGIEDSRQRSFHDRRTLRDPTVRQNRNRRNGDRDETATNDADDRSTSFGGEQSIFNDATILPPQPIPSRYQSRLSSLSQTNFKEVFHSMRMRTLEQITNVYHKAASYTQSFYQAAEPYLLPLAVLVLAIFLFTLTPVRSVPGQIYSYRHSVNPFNYNLNPFRSSHIPVIGSASDVSHINRKIDDILKINRDYKRENQALKKRLGAFETDLQSVKADYTSRFLPVESKVKDLDASWVRISQAAQRGEPRFKDEAKVNFCSTGLGTVVDPYITSPTKVRNRGFLQRSFGWKNSILSSLPPSAALEPWNDIGDCWCAAANDGQVQLGVVLARKIFPTEVVIEHMPRGATVDWTAAPRQMELWVQILHDEARSDVVGQLEEMYGPDNYEYAYGGGKESSLHYSYVRVARFWYDLNNKEEHRQSFYTDVDLQRLSKVYGAAAAIDKVSLRIVDNYGNKEFTCLYRFKLHGHLFDATRDFNEDDVANMGTYY